MNIIIQPIAEKYLQPALDLVEEVFTEHENAAEGKLVRALVEEIRAKEYYLPELELIAVDENDSVVGYVMFSRFHLEGRFADKLLILTPAAVKTALQRRHISKRIIEYGFEKALAMGFEAILVEGNPANYRARGFVTAADHGILPGKTVHLPHIDCLMIKELVPGATTRINGVVEYDCYKTLTSPE